MDIGDLIQFKPKGADDGKPPKVPVYRLYNRPIRVLAWTIQNSRFSDGSGEFAEVVCETLDGEKETLRFNAGSKVVCDELERVSEALNGIKPPPDDRSFTCVIRATGNFIKMYPLEVKNDSGERS